MSSLRPKSKAKEEDYRAPWKDEEEYIRYKLEQNDLDKEPSPKKTDEYFWYHITHRSSEPQCTRCQQDTTKFRSLLDKKKVSSLTQFNREHADCVRSCWWWEFFEEKRRTRLNKMAGRVVKS